MLTEQSFPESKTDELLTRLLLNLYVQKKSTSEERVGRREGQRKREREKGWKKRERRNGWKEGSGKETQEEGKGGKKKGKKKGGKTGRKRRGGDQGRQLKRQAEFLAPFFLLNQFLDQKPKTKRIVRTPEETNLQLHSNYIWKLFLQSFPHWKL